MEKYMKKVGPIWKEVKPGDLDATHVMMSMEERQNDLQEKIDLRNEIESLQKKAEQDRNEYEEDLDSMQRSYGRQLSRAKRECQDKLNEVQKQANDKEQVANEKMQKAEGLLKYVKEKLTSDANKKRGDKRKEAGYVVTAIEELRVVDARNDRTYKKVPLRPYRTIIETPWPDTMDLVDVKNFAREDEYGGLVYPMDDILDKNIMHTDEDSATAYLNQENKVPRFFDLRFRTNRNGLWEIVCMHYGLLQKGRHGRSRKYEQRAEKNKQWMNQQKQSQPVQHKTQHHGGMSMH